jgi:hypothetical protein
MAMTKLEKLIRKAKDTIEWSQGDLKSFATDFAKDPAHAFEWSQKAFESAGRQRAGQTVLAWIQTVHKNKPELDDDGVAALVIAEITQTVVRKAKWPDRSTSTPSNEMSLYTNAAFAEYLD